MKSEVAISLIKAFRFTECKTEGDSGVFSGYASAYAKDLTGDKIAPGAFGKTIAEHKGLVPILNNHDVDQHVGYSTSLSEDGKGLAMSGKLATNTPGGNSAYQLLKLADWDFDDASGLRTINEIDLWEISLTPFPAQPKAFVQDVKTFRDFEKYLRDVENFSRPDARRIMRAMSETRLPLRGMPDGANRLLRGLVAQTENL
jgi:Escherichia/Staphylococcus phage prohead protease